MRLYAVRCFVDPFDSHERGLLHVRSTTIFRPGTLLDPTPPAACGGRVVAVTAVCEAVVEALSQARPDHATAASSVIHPFTLARRRASLEPWLLLSYEYGGLGARRGSDGPSATGSFFLGGRNVVPQVEPLEARLPIVFETLKLDSGLGWGGALAWWPGRRDADSSCSRMRSSRSAAERVRLPPLGREGGADGKPGDQFALRVGWSDVVSLPAEVCEPTHVSQGETVVSSRTSGGGGLGRSAQIEIRRALEADLAEGLRDCRKQHAANTEWSPGHERSPVILGADIGGTFTDVVLTRERWAPCTSSSS